LAVIDVNITKPTKEVKIKMVYLIEPIAKLFHQALFESLRARKFADAEALEASGLLYNCYANA
jgi:hypothetical protein